MWKEFVVQDWVTFLFDIQEGPETTPCGLIQPSDDRYVDLAGMQLGGLMIQMPVIDGAAVAIETAPTVDGPWTNVAVVAESSPTGGTSGGRYYAPPVPETQFAMAIYLTAERGAAQPSHFDQVLRWRAYRVKPVPTSPTVDVPAKVCFRVVGLFKGGLGAPKEVVAEWQTFKA